MDLFTNRFNCTSISVIGQYNRISEIRSLIGFLGVNSDKIKHFPNFLQKAIKIEFKIAADDNSVRFLSQHVDFLQRNLIDFIIAIKAINIFSVTFNCID